MRTADFDYDLPDDFVAQRPAHPRDSARLMVLDRDRGTLTHAEFRDLGRFIKPGDLLVLNQTRVIPARLSARKIPGGGRVEILLLRSLDARTWEVMVRGKRVVPGLRLEVGEDIQAKVLELIEGSRRIIRFSATVESFLPQIGQVPIPPYIREPLSDPERYQTVYARCPGSVAAPTAGLHFTPELLARLKAQGVGITKLTLHVGLHTFSAVKAEVPQEHRIHHEWYLVPAEAAHMVKETKRAGGRVIAVGTTAVRALESAAENAGEGEQIAVHEGFTDLYILPGYRFRVVDAMITNFHRPRSTLLMLVSAFADRERILSAYEVAKQEGYRFYSFGDAMLIL